MRTPRDDDPLHAAIHAKLAEIVAASPTPPPWYEAWARLGSQPSEAERLAVYRAVVAAESLPWPAGFYLVSWQIDALTLGGVEEEFHELEERLRALEQAHGLGEEESWPPGEAPAEYQEVQRQLHEAWDALYVAKLEEFGEPDMAELYRTDRAKFEQLSEDGRRFFHEPDSEDVDDTDWLDGLLEAVAGCVEPDSPMGPLGLHYREEDDEWEVWIYPTPVELVGGAHDGEIVVPGFALDLEQLRDVFDSVTACAWDALGLNDPDGPHVSVEGVYLEREVWLRVLAQAPEDEEPGLKFDMTRKPRQPD